MNDSAKIIRSFIEQYHEKLEEDYIFPRFRKHNLFVELVNVLQQQHEAGRRVTEKILTLSGSGLKSNDDKPAAFDLVSLSLHFRRICAKLGDLLWS